MATLDRTQLDELRGRLTEDRESLKGQIDEIENDVVKAENQYDPEFSGYGNHMAETGTEIYEQERGLAVEQSLMHQLGEVEHALAKVDAGTYGTCDNCGAPIPYERLQARPQATLCVNCKEQQESQRH